MFVAAAEPVKLAMLTLTNTSASRRRFSIFGYAEWRLGPPRSGEHRFVVTDVDPASGAILATNTYNSDFAGALSFFRATLPPQSYTADRDRVRRPQPLAHGAGGALSRAAWKAGAAPAWTRARRCRSSSSSSPANRVASGSRWGRGAITRRGARSPSATAGSRRSSRRSTRSSGCGTTASGRSRCTRPTIRSI